MDEFADKNVVYFGKVNTTDDGRIHVKIGSAGHINEVASRIKIMNVFKCDDHEDFEEFLRGHEDVARHKVKYSRGVFSMTEEDLERAVTIATRNVIQFRHHVTQREWDDAIESSPCMRKMCEKLRFVQQVIN